MTHVAPKKNIDEKLFSQLMKAKKETVGEETRLKR
jgi:hypothetical protein